MMLHVMQRAVVGAGAEWRRVIGQKLLPRFARLPKEGMEYVNNCEEYVQRSALLLNGSLREDG